MRGIWTPAPYAHAEMTIRLLKWRHRVPSGGAKHLIQSQSFPHQRAQTKMCHALMQGLWSPAPWARCELTVRLLKWRYPTLSGGTERLFQPPIAVQRHAFVAAALRRARATSFVDLGCGDGKLLEYLVTQVRSPPKPSAGRCNKLFCSWIWAAAMASCWST